MNIMIVDDNPSMRRVIREAACREGDVVRECVDGREAVNVFPLFRPDIVLMDIELPVMDGIAAAERVLAIAPNVRIIFITSHNTSAFRLKARMLRASGFVLKDDLSDLRRLLEAPPA